VSERRARRARPPGSAPSQHFLRTQALAAGLVRDAGVGPGDLALDLGAGSGRLTAELARAARRVVAVELDPHWSAQLRDRWSNVEVVHADAATVPLPGEPFRVVANLPFDRTTAILRHLLDDPRVPLERADVIVEWGVAVKRAVPWPSTLNGVLWGAWYSSAVTRRLLRGSFAPPPRVDAGVLVFRRRPSALVPVECHERYRRFVAVGFRHGLRAVASARALRGLTVAGAQPRELDAHAWAALFGRCGLSGSARGGSSRRGVARAEGRRPGRPRRGS
jgi:16S rRNA A1518/A1519 N6-dimethyltransferase RsmA/KsgA/DIM1 with predicted DNA glycosylase/AP lyase activity